MRICPRCQGSFEEGIAYCPKDGSRLTTLSKMTSVGQPVSPEAQQALAQAHAEEGVEDLTGRTIAGRYRILRRLGEGGMGVVYAAVDDRLEKEVAIKVLKEDFARRPDVVARFTQEAKSAARIKHENVLDVTDYGQTEAGSFYIAMELLVGTDLADVLQKDGTIDAARACAIAVQVTRALGAAHSKGIVHRDLKPENIFLVRAADGREVVKIVDFGIAQMKDLSGGGADGSRKLTRTGMIFGTPEYMSPEQAAGKQIDHRVDIYAVGVILYEMLAGRVPFVGDTFMGVLTQHMFEQPPPIRSIKPDADVPPELEAVINKALQKAPNERYQSMQELTDDLLRVLEGRAPIAQGTPAPLPARPSAMTSANRTLNTPPGVVNSTATAPEFAKERKDPRKTLMIVGGLAALVIAVAGTLALARPSGSSGATRAGRPSANTTVSNNGSAGASTALPERASHADTIPTTAVDAGVVAPASVRVRIVTSPVPGRVEVEGNPGLACANTPCSLVLPRGSEVRLRATATRKRGELVFTPEREGQEVTIAMTPLATGSASPSPRPSSNGNSHSGGGRNTAQQGRCRPGQVYYVIPGTSLRQPCALLAQ